MMGVKIFSHSGNRNESPRYSTAEVKIEKQVQGRKQQNSALEELTWNFAQDFLPGSSHNSSSLSCGKTLSMYPENNILVDNLNFVEFLDGKKNNQHYKTNKKILGGT